MDDNDYDEVAEELKKLRISVEKIFEELQEEMSGLSDIIDKFAEVIGAISAKQTNTHVEVLKIKDMLKNLELVEPPKKKGVEYY